MRITGLATGLDMDEIIKNSMKPYRIKIDRKGQDKEILEIKQKLYREVIKDSREFYNKYFDVTKKDSLLLTQNWSNVKFKSSNEDVLTVTGGIDAKAETYTITGTPATAAKGILTSEVNNGDEIVINGKKFTLNGATEKERANNLNKQLKEAGINVSVRYSEFAGDGTGVNKKGLIFESTVLGKDGTFTIGGNIGKPIGREIKGEDATAATLTGFTVQDLIDSAGEIIIGKETIKIDIPEDINPEDLNKEIEKLLNTKLSDKNLSAEIDDSGNITFISKKKGANIETPNIKINGKSYDFKGGSDATPTENTIEISQIEGEKISINGNMIDLSKIDSSENLETYLNRVLKEQNINITAKLDGENLILTSDKAGANSPINVELVDVKPNDENYKFTEGNNAEISITDSKGGIYKHTGNSNTITLDGVTFKFLGEIPAEGVKVNGKVDTTEVKDKLVGFINDYNTLIEKLNTLTMEKRDKNFMPLTEEQKKEMSESEVKLWNEKVQKGQLSRDNDLTRISNSMKQAMRTLVDGSEINLEKIGIVPVADYSGVKNGTFTIDENKLEQALETDFDEIVNLFTRIKPTDESLSSNEKYVETGIMQRLKDVLYNETVTVTSSLIKKAGIDGSSTAYTNEITMSIQKYEQKMKDMEKDFLRREQLLYNKYARLESTMNKYNSQQSYLMQQLGMS